MNNTSRMPVSFGLLAVFILLIGGPSCELGGFSNRIINLEIRKSIYISEANGNRNESSDTVILHLQG